MSLLLERGAEVDHRDSEGMTALLVAAFEGHSEVCELLLEGGADVDHADSTGRTPLFAAASMGHAHVVSSVFFCRLRRSVSSSRVEPRKANIRVTRAGARIWGKWRPGPDAALYGNAFLFFSVRSVTR